MASGRLSQGSQEGRVSAKSCELEAVGQVVVSPGQARHRLPALSQSVFQARGIPNILRGLCARLALARSPPHARGWWWRERE